MTTTTTGPTMEQQNQALNVLVNAVRLAQKRGAFNLDEAAVIGTAVSVFAPAQPEATPADDREEETVHDYEEHSVYKIDYTFLRKQYENIAKDVIRKYDINDYYLSDIWYNYYKEGQFQEPHVHDGNGGLTAVHYLIFDHKYHSPTLFTDSTIRPLRVRCGDIVFFPNDVEHYVPENQTDKPRLTIAFTVTKVH